MSSTGYLALALTGLYLGGLSLRLSLGGQGEICKVIISALRIRTKQILGLQEGQCLGIWSIGVHAHVFLENKAVYPKHKQDPTL